MAKGYQDEVNDFIDYNNVLTPFGFSVRGPFEYSDESLSNSISFLGAAQTYGVWCDFPFPLLVSNALSLKCFNLGHAGAGPAAFIKPEVIEAVNKTKACVIQTMSGRSVSNRYMQQVSGAARVVVNHPKLDKQSMLAHAAYSKLHPILTAEEMKGLVHESLERYIKQYEKLASLIKVPKILLWLSSREPAYSRDYSDVNKMLGSFPHLVDSPTFKKISESFENVVIACSSRLLKRPLWSHTLKTNYTVSRGWGTVSTYSRHYAHPYLHILASYKILEKIDELAIL